MYVLTINQRDSREVGDLVPELIKSLRHLPAAIPFQRSVGDEAIGAVAEASTAIDAALIALRSRRWHVGIGVGELRLPLPPAIKDAEGYGLVYARRAVNRAQKTGERVPLAVSGPDADVAAEAEAVLRLLGQIVATRTEAEWKVLDLMTPGARGQQKFIAEELGITSQAVSKAVVRSHWMEEWACRPAAARLLDLVYGPRSLPAAALPY
jgi:chorismate mutase